MKTNTLIKGSNQYSFEGTETGKSWSIEVIDNNNLLNNTVAEQLKDFNQSIYFNETSGDYFIFDFKIDNVWFESRQIDCNNMEILLNAFN